MRTQAKKDRALKPRPKVGRLTGVDLERLVRPRLSAQVLKYHPELTHSVWTDFLSRHRTRAALETCLRKAVRDGEYVGYRLVRIEAQYIGTTWPNDQGQPRAASRKDSNDLSE